MLFPLSADIRSALKYRLDARGQQFGVFLGVDPLVMAAIDKDKKGKPEDCMLELVGKWTSRQEGTGTIPCTWQTVVKAVKNAGDGVLAEDLALEHGVHLMQ